MLITILCYYVNMSYENKNNLHQESPSNPEQLGRTALEAEVLSLRSDKHLDDFALLTSQKGLAHTEDRLDQLERDSQIDDLTKLYSQEVWKDLLDKKVEENLSENNQVAVAFVDLDAFKVVNDTLGHPEGDELLKSYTKKLAASLRSGENVPGRLGGDEFGIFGVLTQRSDRVPMSDEEMYEGFRTHIQEINDDFLANDPVALRIRQQVPEFGMTTGFASTLDGYGDGKTLYKVADDRMLELKEAKGSAR